MDKPVPPPEGTLQESKMIDILIDIHLAEAFVSTEILEANQAKELFKIYEDSIFKVHSVSKERYYQSHGYYTKNTDKFKLIYGVVVDSLSARKTKIAPPPSIDTK